MAVVEAREEVGNMPASDSFEVAYKVTIFTACRAAFFPFVENVDVRPSHLLRDKAVDLLALLGCERFWRVHGWFWLLSGGFGFKCV